MYSWCLKFVWGGPASSIFSGLIWGRECVLWFGRGSRCSFIFTIYAVCFKSLNQEKQKQEKLALNVALSLPIHHSIVTTYIVCFREYIHWRREWGTTRSFLSAALLTEPYVDVTAHTAPSQQAVILPLQGMEVWMNRHQIESFFFFQQ